MGDTSETNTKVLSGELFVRCGSTTNAYTENRRKSLAICAKCDFSPTDMSGYKCMVGNR